MVVEGEEKGWPYVTLNVHPETRNKILGLAKVKTGPRRKYERSLETADEIINRLIDQHNGDVV